VLKIIKPFTKNNNKRSAFYALLKPKIMKEILSYIIILITQFSIAQHTSIPDTSFEQALIDLNLDNALDGQVLTARIDTLKYLDISHKNINDITGIQDFLRLETLNATSNHITNVNISNLNYLQEAYFEYNSLISVSVTNCPSLFIFSCHNNNITTLNLQGNTNLSYLYAMDNNIINIDVTSLVYLYDLIIYSNNIESIDLSNNYNLENLLIHNNNLINLDVFANYSLLQVTCANNPRLEGTLNLSHTNMLQFVQIDNTNIELLNVKNGNNINLNLTATNCNELSCIIVDNSQGAYLSNWYYPNNTNIVGNVTDCNSNNVESNSINKIVIYPTPAVDKIYFTNIMIFNTVYIYDVLGKIIKIANIVHNSYVDVKSLPNGFYILKLKNKEIEITKKIIIKR